MLLSKGQSAGTVQTDRCYAHFLKIMGELVSFVIVDNAKYRVSPTLFSTCEDSTTGGQSCFSTKVVLIVQEPHQKAYKGGQPGLPGGSQRPTNQPTYFLIFLETIAPRIYRVESAVERTFHIFDLGALPLYQVR